MHFSGEVEIAASQDAVWTFLTDPDRVASCAPGLKSLEILEPDKKFRVVVSVGFGAVKTTFSTDVEWVEMQPTERAVLKAHGKAPGSAIDASSEMKLLPGSDGGTKLNWTADVVVLGTIASLAARLMGSVTEKLTGDFFSCVKAKIEA
ncbi:MAG TPA: carbon monoxide dehydrogenase subunit G [Anaerolineales bacterium]|nr:carbon monoxide dehydrogenase subunit G [Anaerolineales bacterium]